MTKPPEPPLCPRPSLTTPAPATCALVHGLRPWNARMGFVGLLFLALAACGDADGAAAEARAAELSTQAEIQLLVELSTPLDPTLTSDHHDRHHHARVAQLEKLRGGERALGQLALQRFLEVEERAEVAPILVRVGLLDIAGHCATEDTQPLLETLLLEYGHRPDIRAEATRILGKVAPARAVELIGPLLEKTKRTSTMPADEFLLQAYIDGCSGSGQDPVPILVDVATNIYKEDAARHRAVQELGKHKTLLAQQALRSILVESTGNAYLRRKAAQSIRECFPREQACAIFGEVAGLEADNNFLAFLGDMIAENCD